METQIAKTPTQNENLSRALELYRCIDESLFQRLPAYAAPEFEAHFGGNVLDAANWIGMAQAFMTAFPDGRHVFELAEAVGDYVLLHGYFTGTHTGPLQGMPATGRTVRCSLTMIDEWKGGKLVLHRADFDAAGMMAQLSAGAA